jgi:selenoprotein W-related protein
LLRAAWTAQELLTTFVEEVEQVSLKPGTGGIFRISVNEEALFDRKEAGSVPEIKFLKQILRDKIAPDKSLGHSDTKG